MGNAGQAADRPVCGASGGLRRNSGPERVSVGPANETRLFSKPVFNYQTRRSGTRKAGPEKGLVLQKGLGIDTSAFVPKCRVGFVSPLDKGVCE